MILKPLSFRHRSRLYSNPGGRNQSKDHSYTIAALLSKAINLEFANQVLFPYLRGQPFHLVNPSSTFKALVVKQRFIRLESAGCRISSCYFHSLSLGKQKHGNTEDMFGHRTFLNPAPMIPPFQEFSNYSKFTYTTKVGFLAEHEANGAVNTPFKLRDERSFTHPSI